METIREVEPMQNLLDLGLHLRPGRLRDLRKVVPMLNRSSRAIYGAAQFGLARYHAKWRAPDLDLASDTRIVFTGEGEPVGLVEVWRLSDPPAHPLVRVRVDPRWEDRGVGSAMLKWARERSLQIAEQVPSGVRVVIRMHAPDHHRPTVEMLTRFGMQPVRASHEMVIDLDAPLHAPSWPAGIELRGFRFPGDCRALYHADQQAFQDHWGNMPVDDERGFVRWRHHEFEQHVFDPSLWFLALDRGQIAGFVLGRPHGAFDPSMGWVGDLAVLPPWRQRGLGTALLQHAFCVFKSRGRSRVGLMVDSENLSGANRLYRKAGMRIHRRFTTYELELRPGRELQTE